MQNNFFLSRGRAGQIFFCTRLTSSWWRRYCPTCSLFMIKFSWVDLFQGRKLFIFTTVYAFSIKSRSRSPPAFVWDPFLTLTNRELHHTTHCCTPGVGLHPTTTHVATFASYDSIGQRPMTRIVENIRHFFLFRTEQNTFDARHEKTDHKAVPNKFFVSRPGGMQKPISQS